MTAPDELPPRPPFSPRLWPAWTGLSLALLAARLPWLWQRAIGRGVGWLALHLAGTRRRAAQANIELCFPEQSPQWRARLLRDSFDALGVGLFEFARAWWGGLGPIRRGASIEGLEHLRALQEQGRGVLLVSGHFMTLEMCGRLLCDHVPVSGMYRVHRNPVMEWAVKRGGFLWYAPDQDMRGKDTVFAPFFGVPASTITATHQLARLTGCAVVPFFHRREGARYVLRVAPPLADFPSQDVVADTTRVNAAIEAMVREAPAQYLWIHRRFKRQPEGAPVRYPRRARRP